MVNGDVTEIDDATLEIGVKGGDFQTLATFQGDFYADDSDIDLTGMLTVDVNGQTVTLFDGEVNIPRGTAGGDAEDGDDSVADFKVAGLEFDLTQLTFTPGILQLQGSVKLPTEWGDVSFSVNDPNYLQITSAGAVSITGADIALPDFHFNLFGADIESTGLQAHYLAGTTGEPGEPGTPDSLEISGEVKIGAEIKGVMFTIDADLSASDDPTMDNYILIESTNNINSPYTVNVKGVFSFTDNFFIPPPGQGLRHPSGAWRSTRWTRSIPARSRCSSRGPASTSTAPWACCRGTSTRSG